MAPSKAAAVIGCSNQHVRYLIRTGKLPATKVFITEFGPSYFVYNVKPADAQRMAKELNRSKRGYPIGRKRKLCKPT